MKSILPLSRSAFLFGVSCDRSIADDFFDEISPTGETNSSSREWIQTSELATEIRFEDLVIDNFQIDRNDENDVRGIGQISERNLYSVKEPLDFRDACLYDSNSIHIEKIALMQVPIQDIATEEIVMRPCWIISSIRRDSVVTEYEVFRSTDTFIDAFTRKVLCTCDSTLGECA